MSIAMKNLLRPLVVLGLVLLPCLAQAQCTPPPIPANAEILPPAKVDSAFGSSTTTHYLCDNSTLYYSDLAPDTIYMGGSSRLIISGSTDLTVYMNANCTLEINPVTSTPKHIRTLIVRPIFTSFQDTNFIVIDTVITCSSLNYDFSLFPGGVNPCAALDAEAPAEAQAVWTVSPNPFADRLTLDLAGEGKGRPLSVLNALGQTVAEVELIPGRTLDLELAALPAGLYTLRLQDGTRWSARKVLKVAH
jgi:hypothetical protein